VEVGCIKCQWWRISAVGAVSAILDIPSCLVAMVFILAMVLAQLLLVMVIVVAAVMDRGSVRDVGDVGFVRFLVGFGTHILSAELSSDAQRSTSCRTAAQPTFALFILGY
jgi:hypothetical protein